MEAATTRNAAERVRYVFGLYALDLHDGLLLRDGVEIHLTWKCFAALRYLMERGDVVSRDELLDEVWPEGFVEPSNVTQTIYMLRKTLGGGTPDHAFIKTIAGRGYRFTASWQAVELPPEDHRAAANASELEQTSANRASSLWRRWLAPLAAAVLVGGLGFVPSSIGGTPTSSLRIDHAIRRDYVLGRYYWNRRTTADMNRGLTYFQRVIKAAPWYAPAYSGVADTYAMLIANDLTRDIGRAKRLAREAAAEAERLDPGLAETEATLGVIAADIDHDYPRGAAHFRKALTIDPNYAPAREWMAWMLFSRGDVEQAVAEMQRARDADPTSPIINAALAMQLYYARRYEEAEAQWRAASPMMSDRTTAALGLGLVQEALGRTGEAQTNIARAQALMPQDSDVLGALAHLYAVTHRTHEAEQILKRLTQMNPRPSFNIALVDYALGRRDEALKTFALVYKTKAMSLNAMLDPRADGLRAAIHDQTI